MPVSNSIANGYIQLGVSGATLLVLLVLIILLFRFISINNKTNAALQSTLLTFVTDLNKEENQNQNVQYTKLDKLCDKIDSLITSNSEHTTKLNEVLLCNDKDQKETIKMLTTILELNMDIQRRVARVDDRTYRCLGNSKKEES
jgi:uncharacterized membrane protein YgaE (UPF0421/DUF939 family)